MCLQKKYCAFLDDNCNKKIEFDEFKIFFAYPSDQHIKGYINEICNSNQLVGLKLFPWEKLADTAGIVFCKVCQEIESSRAFVAEITYLNQNVLFELGYAIARGKTPILIREKSRNTKVLDIFADVKYLEYDDLNVLAKKIYKSAFEKSYFPDPAVEKELEKTFFITADANMPVKRLIYEHLELFSKDTSFSITIDDTSEITIHKLLYLLKNIEESKFIVCHMVGTNFKRYNEINAHVSFLAGYALGKSKRLLILQESPADKMIDLQQMRKEYFGKDKAIDYLDKWLAPEWKMRKKELELKKKEKETTSLFEKLSIALGHPAAEYDTNLNNCFIQTSAFRDAKKLRKYLFLGRRGAGKSANFFQLSKSFSEQLKNIVVSISPAKLQIIGSIDKLYETVGKGKTTALFEIFWQFVLLTEIAIRYLEYEQEGVFLKEPELTIKVSKLLAEHKILTDVSFDVRFNNLIDQFCIVALASNPSEIRTQILQNFYKSYFSESKKIIVEITRNHPVTVLIDNLDRDWDVENMLSISSLINSLLDVMDKINLNKIFGECKIITFLRTDIYQQSSKLDADFDKRQYLSLSWDRELLLQVVGERIALAKGKCSSDSRKLWESTFGFKNDKIPDSFEFVIKRTMLRPRDILYFCSIILDQANRRSVLSVDEYILIEAERIFSDYLLKNLTVEYGIGYPSIEDICIALFLGKNNYITDEELKKRFKDEMGGAYHYGLEDIIKFCFDAGVMGISFNEKEYFSFENNDYVLTMNQAKDSSNYYYCIHPGLHRVLSIRKN
ncbi:MAG: hypothetical protein PHP35_01930 [Candidatus Colwellbacteria bacterium]|nr:hypothetical protein [Candidatus Colwellbacteria bacterium]